MKLSIWKFPLGVEDYQQVLMPINAKVLSVQAQNNKPTLWAICDTETDKKECREFTMFGTGCPFYEGVQFGKEQQFIGTFQLHGGTFVGHLFELVEVKVIQGL